MAKNLFSLLALAGVSLMLGLGSCQSSKPMMFYDEHNSQNSVSWGGIYTGVIPAASGPGIDVKIALYYNETFELRYHYIGGDIDNTVRRKGTFNWNEAGLIVILDIDDFPPYYWVGSNQLTQLDMNRKLISGDLADNYVLKKIMDFDWPGEGGLR